jgi:hypothetical protein
MATRRRVLGLAISTVVLATALVGLGPAAPAGAGYVTTEKTLYGLNEAVIVDIGSAEFNNACSKQATKGIDDYVYAMTNLYVVGGTTPLGDGAKLTDASGGAPNVVFGAGGGGFFWETIAYTKPQGNLGPGTYSVVLDICQNGVFDPEDSFIPDVFTVVAEPLVLTKLNITALKSQHTKKADSYALAERGWKQLEKIAGEKTKLSQVTNVSVSVFRGVALAQGVPPSALNFVNPQQLLATLLAEKKAHHEGLAADPVDPDFQQLTVVEDVTPAVPVDGDLTMAEAYAAASSDHADSQLIEALIHSIERYQGAAEAGNGEWALIHARQAAAFARLLADRLPTTTAAYHAWADAVDVEAASGGDLNGYYSLPNVTGRMADYLRSRLGIHPINADLLQAMENQGVAQADLRAEAASIIELDMQGFDWPGFADDLRGLVADNPTEAAQYLDLAAQLDAKASALAADPLVSDGQPIAEAGGPYVGSTGTPISVDGSASTGEAPLSFNWDLDGDGAFDDATGPTPSFVPDDTVPLVGLRVTASNGSQAVDWAVVGVADVDAPPVVDLVAPDAWSEIQAGSSQPFEVTATDDVGVATVEFYVDGMKAGDGSAFTYGSGAGEVGLRVIQAVATDTAGQTGVGRFDLWVHQPDADGDGYEAHVDCDDTDPAVNPAAIEVLNGIDDDCNPATADEGVAPSIAGSQIYLDTSPLPNDGRTASEGVEAEVRVNWSHPLKSSGAPFPYTVDFGDGTSVSGVWQAGGAADPSRIIEPHTWSEPHSNMPITVCITGPSGKVACHTRDVFGVYGTVPVVNPATLVDWTVEHRGAIEPHQHLGEWLVQPHGAAALQMNNVGFPTVMYGDTDLPAGQRGRVDLAVESTADDDWVGLVLGFQPGDTANPAADWLVLDWRRVAQSIAATPCVSGGGTTWEGLAVSRVRGIGNQFEFQHHETDDPTGVDSSCSDGQGLEELARGSTRGGRPVGLGHVAARWPIRTTDPAQHDPPSWDLHPQRVEVEYTPENLKVWVNDTLEIDLDSPPGDPFPMGRIGFYNVSQGAARYIGYDAEPVFTMDEGAPGDVTIDYADGDPSDTHTGLLSWGDDKGPDVVPALPTAPGEGTLAGSHTYLDDGEYQGRACVTDEDALTGCNLFDVQVQNLPPVVRAGPDRPAGSDLVLTSTGFTDPGVLDTHTATIDWGDGSPIEVGAVSEDQGAGIVTGAHTYTADGTFTVEVCVADDEGDSDCDDFEADVRAVNVSPMPDGQDDETVDEGDLVTRQIAFSDDNVSDVHSIDIDWGDGSPSAPADFQENGAVGVGSAVHTYTDDGLYDATFEVCDDAGGCGSAAGRITVANVAPTPIISSASVGVGGAASLSAAYSDPGADDTHTATVDWGDGSGPVVVAPGADTVAASSAYAANGTYDVELCVTDDDGGRGCDQAQLVVEGVVDPDAPPPPPPAPGDGSGAAGGAVEQPSGDAAANSARAVAPAAAGDVGNAAVDASVTSGALPVTGSSSRQVVLVGLVLLAAGALVLAGSRRARSRPTT